LSVAKIISTGQGGFIATDNEQFATKVRANRTHGIENIQDPGIWGEPGYNFRITDMQSAIGLIQLSRIYGRMEKLVDVHGIYLEGLKDCQNIRVIPVNVEQGEIPLYVEALTQHRSSLMEYLSKRGIETRPFYPNLSDASYFEKTKSNSVRSDVFSKGGIYLPSGPTQLTDDLLTVVEAIREWDESLFDLTAKPSGLGRESGPVST